MANTNTSPKTSIDTNAPILGYKPSSPRTNSPNTATTGSNTGGFWSSITKALTNDREDRSGAEANERSVSRGRDIASTGRGGAGNLVRGESATRAQAGIKRSEDGDERGRDVAPRETDRITHAGRGGEGNVRSPSRDPAKDAADRAYEDDVLRKSREHRDNFGISHGRGGGGNISASRSRSREPKAGAAHGRGGFGNIDPHIPGGHDLEKLEEEERAAVHHHHSLLSHGRGGQGNLGEAEATEAHGTRVAPELAHHGVGRGGVGNVV